MIILPTVSSAALTPTNSALAVAPVNTVAPFITGQTTEGQTLTAHVGTWAPTPTSFAIQWKREGVPIAGAAGTDYTYLLTAADVASHMSFDLTGSIGNKSTTVTSAATGLIGPNTPPNFSPGFTVNPSLVGSPIVGNAVTIVPGLVTGYPVPTVVYDIKSNGVSVGAGPTYTLVTGDLGHTITVTATATNSGGSFSSTSAAIGPVTAASPAAATKIGINLSGMEYGDSTSTYAISISDAMLNEVKAKGFTDVRIQLSWDRLFPITTPTTLNATGYGNLKDILTRLGAKGMTGIVDIHAFGARQVTVSSLTSVVNDTSFTTWIGEDATPVSNGFIEGTNTFYGAHRIRKTFALSVGTATGTVKLKAGTRSWARVIMINDAVSAATVLQPQINLTTGVVTPGYSTTNGTVTSSGPDASGYYTITLNYTVATAGNYRLYIEANIGQGDNVSDLNLTYTGDNVSQPLIIASAVVNNTSTSSVYASIGSTNLPNSVFSANWQTLVTQLRADNMEPNISAYDIMNEPANVSDANTWFNAAQAAIYAIRSTGSTKCILVEGLPYSGAHTFWDFNPNLHLLVDPASNWIISGHCYGDWDNSGGSTGTPMTWAAQGGKKVEIPCDPVGNPGEVVDEQTLVRRADKMWQGAKARGLTRLHLGEVGVGADNISWNNQVRNLNAWAVTNKVWINYWAGGPAWGDAYQLRLTSYSDGLQAEQMAAFDDYFVNAAPTVYRLTVPTRIAAGATTIPVTVKYNGKIASPITFTLSDSGGGTFSPATLVTDTTENWTGTAQLTPASNTNSTVTCTNNRGLTNPAGKPTSSKVDNFTTTESAGVVTGMACSIWRRIYGSYTGPLVTLWRSSDSTTADIPFVAGTGLLDRTAESAFTTGGGTIRVARVYDQSGATQGIVPRQNVESGWPAVSPTDYPLWISNDGDGKPAVSWTGSSYMDMDYSMLQRGNVTVMAVAQQISGSNALLWQFSNRFLAFPTFADSADNASQTLGVTANSWCQTVVTRQQNSSTGLNGWLNGQKVFTAATLDKSIQVNPDGASGPDYRNGSLGYYRFTYNANTWTGKLRELVILSGVPADAALTPFWTDANSVYSLYTPPATDFNTIAPRIVMDLVAQTATLDGSGVALSTYLSGTLNAPDAVKGTLFDATHSTNITIVGLALTILKTGTFAMRITMNNRVGGFNFILMSTTPAVNGWCSSNGGTWGFGLPGLTGGAVVNDGNPLDITNPTKHLISSAAGGKAIAAAGGVCVGSGTMSAGTPTFTNVYIGEPTSVEGGANGIKGYISKIEIWDVACNDEIQALNATTRSVPVPANYLPTWWSGVNYSGAEFGGAALYPSYDAYGQSIVDYYKSKGCNIFRVPFLWERWQPTAGGALDATHTAQFDAFITMATGKGMHILLDMHNYGSAYGETIGAGGNTKATDTNFAGFWTLIANRYKTNALVHYDLQNEPAAQTATPSRWATTQQAAVTAIRAAGATSQIWISFGEGYSNAQTFQDGSANADSLLTITDSGNNLVYQGHMYLNQDFSGANVPGTIRSQWEGYRYARSFAQWCRRHGVRGAIGETAAMYDAGTYPDQAREYRWFLQELYNNRDAIIGVTLWAGGPYWGSGYFYNNFPANFGTPSQTDQWTMNELAKYPGYTASAPSGLLQQVANRTAINFYSDIYYPGSDPTSPALNFNKRRMWMRSHHVLGGKDVTEIRVVYSGIMNSSGGSDQNIGRNRTIRVGLNIKTGPQGNKAVEFTWGGAATQTITNGALGPFESDPIYPSSFGMTVFPANMELWINYQEDMPKTGTGANAGGDGPVYWTMGLGSLGSKDEIVQFRVAADGDVTLATTNALAGPSGVFNHWSMEPPLAIVGKFVAPEVSVMVTGDSLIHAGHSSGFNNSGAMDGSLTTDGWVLQALNNVNNRNIPTIMAAKFAGAAYQVSTLQPALSKYVTHVVCDHFHNNFGTPPAGDYNMNIGFINRMNAGANAAGRTLKWYWILSTPESGSTDSWSTKANQNIDGAYTARRDGTDSRMLLEIGTRISGAYDFSPVWADPTDKYRWRSNGTPNWATADGTHHTANLWPLMASAYKTDVTSKWTPPGSTIGVVVLGTEINVSSKAGDLTNVYQASHAIDPTNPLLQVITAKYNSESQAVAFTTNDGWSTAIRTNRSAGDPDVFFDKSGISYWSFVDTTNNRTSVSSKSAGGTTWAASVNAAIKTDHPAIWADTSSISPFYNRLYVAGQATGARIGRSDDGVTWTSSTYSTSVPKFDQGTVYKGCCSQNGTVLIPYVSAQTTVTQNGNTGLSSDFYVLRSTNGGASFTAAQVYTAAPVASPGVGGYVGSSNLAYTAPTVALPSGRIHLLVVQDQASAPAKMMYFTSDDLGVTWSPQGNYIGAVTGWGVYCPTILVNNAGQILIHWMATDGTNLRTYAMASKDQGNNWSVPTLISSVDGVRPTQASQLQKPGARQTYGAVALSDGSFQVTWEDARTNNNIYALYTRKITVT